MTDVLTQNDEALHIDALLAELSGDNRAFVPDEEIPEWLTDLDGIRKLEETVTDDIRGRTGTLVFYERMGLIDRLLDLRPRL